MARTRGAKDKRLRKNAAALKQGKLNGVTGTVNVTPAAGRPTSKVLNPKREGIPTQKTTDAKEARPMGPRPSASPLANDEFLAEVGRQIDASPSLSTDRPAGTLPPADPAADVPLTRDAWAAVLRVPFDVAAWLAGYQCIATIGAKRADDLGRASWLLFEHYGRQYMGMDPDNPLSMAWAATGLVLASIVGEIGPAVLEERAARAAVAAKAKEGQGS